MLKHNTKTVYFIEKRMKIPIEKCIDKKAQFHLKVAFIGGPSGVQTRERSATTRKESLKLSKSRR